MKAKMWGLTISVLMLGACSFPASRLPWKKPRSAVYYSNLGTRSLRKGNYRQAIAYFQKSLKINPHSITTREQTALAHFKLGNEYFTGKQYALASEQFQIALALNPELHNARRGWLAAVAGRE